MTDRFATIVVADQAAAQATAGDPAMFTTGLSATGAAPATHWVSSGYMPEELVALFPEATDEEPFAAFARLGLQLTTEQL